MLFFPAAFHSIPSFARGFRSMLFILRYERRRAKEKKIHTTKRREIIIQGNVVEAAKKK